ncbi:MAG: DUF4376 domain-containing protein [Desulfotalea sp.]
MDFFEKTKEVTVSNYSTDGWWAGNEDVLIVAGTTSPALSTLRVYTPSSDQHTAKYLDGSWVECVDNTKISYYLANGTEQRVFSPDTSFPDDAIFEVPPSIDMAVEYLDYQDDKWIIKKTVLGKTFYSGDGKTFIVDTLGFELPENCLWTPPPKPGDQETCIVKDGAWVVVVDMRGTIYYLQNGESVTIDGVEQEPPAGTLLTPPPTDFHTTHNGIDWILDIDKFKLYLCDDKIQTEKSEVKNGGFDVDGMLFDSDNSAQIALTQFMVKLTVDPNYTVKKWKASAGQWAIMTAALFSQVSQAWEDHCTACFDWQEAKEEEISACATAESLEAVLVNYGE